VLVPSCWPRFRPPGRVRCNIVPATLHVFYISYDVIVKASLPQWFVVCRPAQRPHTLAISCHGDGFEPIDNRYEVSVEFRVQTSMQGQDSVHVIWHSNKCIKFDRWKLVWNLAPGAGNHFACTGSNKGTFVAHHSESWGALVETQCDEIWAGVTIIVRQESSGSAKWCSHQDVAFCF